MRIKEINNTLDSLLNLRDWKNPLLEIWIKKKLEFNLLTGENSYNDVDSFLELYQERRNWFLERVHFLKGNLSDFQKAEIIVGKNFVSIHQIIKMREPGIEPGLQRWQRRVLPLNYSRLI